MYIYTPGLDLQILKGHSESIVSRQKHLIKVAVEMVSLLVSLLKLQTAQYCPVDKESLRWVSWPPRPRGRSEAQGEGLNLAMRIAGPSAQCHVSLTTTRDLS